MSPITLIENEVASLYYYPDHKLVYHVFHRPISGAAFQDVLNRGTQALQEYQADKWLSDDRNNMALPYEDQDWAINTWFTQTKAAGWKYWALVVPPNIDAQISLTKSVQHAIQEGVRTRVFVDPAAALKWLQSL